MEPLSTRMEVRIKRVIDLTYDAGYYSGRGYELSDDLKKRAISADTIKDRNLAISILKDAIRELESSSTTNVNIKADDVSGTVIGVKI